MFQTIKELSHWLEAQEVVKVRSFLLSSSSISPLTDKFFSTVVISTLLTLSGTTNKLLLYSRNLFYSQVISVKMFSTALILAFTSLRTCNRCLMKPAVKQAPTTLFTTQLCSLMATQQLLASEVLNFLVAKSKESRLLEHL